MSPSSGDLFAPPPSSGPHIRIGIGGWNYAPWRNNFYPAGLVQRRELEFASRQLRTIEINGTYYGAQKAATYAKWAAETPSGFMFSLKAPRYITEDKRLADVGKGIGSFVHGGLAEMGERLGPILWQLPPSRPFDASDLGAFLEALPRALNGQPLRHVLEVRHPSFMDEHYVALARMHAVPTVFTDSPDYPSLADLTGDFTYARLMRSADGIPTGYAPDELDRWATRACSWAAGNDIGELPHAAPLLPGNKPRDVFMFFISSAKHRNPAAAMALQARVDGQH
ncbi:hypothetical protein GCM10008098_14160 [Rhodanobacter panaciterrae]|uniref:DUF72 domain-containing protein n=1 Tax=Rhodanobacter panaciterrae TaxID=490572 RepID=A0ABQ2ZT23_9GAMM|nr:DUF72 domain-containing protein [Rhodanobacter panaciterrae]GGY22240.1 hypothetical protein GCM10008098_14160 [Rhodanobacter panaciterrae]